MGDPRGIGPEVVRKALRQPLNADVQIVGGWDDDAERSEVEAGRGAAPTIAAGGRQGPCGDVGAIRTGEEKAEPQATTYPGWRPLP